MRFYAKSFDELSTSELYEIIRARQEIFLMEQKIICRDLDGVDYDSLHCYIEGGGRIAAYLRAYLTEDGEVQIGRVLSLTHGRGHGRQLMERAMTAIGERYPGRALTLHAQTHARGFYEKLGFTAVGAEFLEEGIPHITMRRECGK